MNHMYSDRQDLYPLMDSLSEMKWSGWMNQQVLRNVSQRRSKCLCACWPSAAPCWPPAKLSYAIIGIDIHELTNENRTGSILGLKFLRYTKTAVMPYSQLHASYGGEATSHTHNVDYEHRQVLLCYAD
ncbi:unnamed protein product [Camellia sinensis]